ncbi:MAG TPA: tetratricopeptide repeat protein, partial [Kofleriaceae bacterium]|nr:tetratricopeptide repeat protein [Kofleriaceae bacterium]
DRDRRIDLLRQMLDAALEANDASAVRRHAEALLELQPEDTSAYLALKARATSAGDWDALASLLDTRASGTADPSERASRFYELGRLYLDQLEDANAGINAFEQALSARPDHPAALEAIARIAYEKADWPRARELFERMRPETASLAEDALWFRRGEIAEALGREREALDRFREATRVAPSNRAALTAMARAARRLGEHEIALEAMRALVELLPADDVAASTQARLQLGDLHRQLGDRAEAIEYYLMVLREDPRSRPALRALVELYIQLGDYPEAARTLGALTGLASSPSQQAELLFRRGELYLGPIGDADLAADCYLKAIDLAPTHVPTLRRLIDYYWRIEDYQGLLEIAIELDAQRSLPGTDPLPLARALVAAGMRKSVGRAVAIAGALGSETVAALVEVLFEADASGVDAQRLAAAAAHLGIALPDLDLSAVLGRISARDPSAALVGHLLAALNASH